MRHHLNVSEKSIEKSVSSWTVEAEKYGDFLIAIFDEWVRRDVGKVDVMNFEHALTAWLGLPAYILYICRNMRTSWDRGA